MERKEKKMQELAWAEKIAGKYDIFPSTVLDFKKNLVGKMYRNEVYIDRKRRTEEFFELYFAGVKEGINE